MEHLQSWSDTKQWSNLCLGNIRVKKLVGAYFHLREWYQFGACSPDKELREVLQKWNMCMKEKSCWKLHRNFARKGQLRPNREVVCVEVYHQEAS